jgi:hypothetical protein
VLFQMRCLASLDRWRWLCKHSPLHKLSRPPIESIWRNPLLLDKQQRQDSYTTLQPGKHTKCLLTPAEAGDQLPGKDDVDRSATAGNTADESGGEAAVGKEPLYWEGEYEWDDERLASAVEESLRVTSEGRWSKENSSLLDGPYVRNTGSALAMLTCDNIVCHNLFEKAASINAVTHNTSPICITGWQMGEASSAVSFASIWNLASSGRKHTLYPLCMSSTMTREKEEAF